MMNNSIGDFLIGIPSEEVMSVGAALCLKLDVLATLMSSFRPHRVRSWNEIYDPSKDLEINSFDEQVLNQFPPPEDGEPPELVDKRWLKYSRDAKLWKQELVNKELIANGPVETERPLFSFKNYQKR